LRRCETFNAQDIKIDLELFKKLCDFVLKREKKDGNLNVVFVGMNM